MEIDPRFEQLVDPVLHMLETASRLHLLQKYLGLCVEKISSGTKKREWFDTQVKIVNAKWENETGITKYEIKRGFNGGLTFTDEYLRSIGQKTSKKQKTFSPSKEELYQMVQSLELKILRLENRISSLNVSQ